MTHMSRRITPETYRLASKVPVRIVLENIRSGLNVGAFFRTGDALRIDGIDLCGYTARPPHREILKSALGATEHVTWMAHDNALKAIESLRTQGYLIAAVEQTEASISLLDWNPDPSSKWAFIFGNEVRGIEEQTLVACDTAIQIPQFGVKQSLNVSVCGGIVLWESARRLGFPE
ncbi:MAG TPA: RNA methyltransferase [Flavobacteriales bacterium]|nr:RNA methyltransferase [Flavobacteriales bacterium]|tara:strand:+ start:189 stop:713 length:525 start_codon:yes stop_codon:yes gene_type:complete